LQTKRQKAGFRFAIKLFGLYIFTLPSYFWFKKEFKKEFEKLKGSFYE
jgi:hypothetical protein